MASSSRIFASLAAASTFALAANAHADDAASYDVADDRRAVALEVHPLAIAANRFGAQVEVLPVAHHAFVVNPYYDDVTDENVLYRGYVVRQQTTGFGAELGYRYYTGEHGPNGFFVGPSLIVGTYGDKSSERFGTLNFMTVGGAVDIGGQAVIGPGVVIGGGFGLEMVRATKDTGSGHGFSGGLAYGGIFPRVLFSVGYAF